MKHFTNEELDQLQALHSAATPGQWLHRTPNSGTYPSCGVMMGATIKDPYLICYAHTGHEERANAALIAAAHNALPALIAQARPVEASAAELTEQEQAALQELLSRLRLSAYANIVSAAVTRLQGVARAALRTTPATTGAAEAGKWQELQQLMREALPLPYVIGEGSEGGRYYMNGNLAAVAPGPGNVLGGTNIVHCFSYWKGKENAAFIAAACNAIPGLLAENERLRTAAPTPAAAPEAPAEAGSVAPVALPWISVKDRLPDHNRTYLVVARKADYRYIKTSCLNPAKTAFYVEYDEEGEYPVEEVTHWMETDLPALPAPTMEGSTTRA